MGTKPCERNEGRYYISCHQQRQSHHKDIRYRTLIVVHVMRNKFAVKTLWVDVFEASTCGPGFARQPLLQEVISMSNNKPITIEQMSQVVPTMALLTVACKANGIARTTAWKLAKLKLLDTVSIGRRRYVLLSSFEKLAERLAALKDGEV